MERRGTLVPRADGFLVLIKPLFRLPQEGERKQAEPDSVSRNAPYSYDFAELQEVLEMGVSVLIRLATEWASLHHVYEAGLQLKIHVPNINVGSSCHIGSWGTKKLWRVFSAMGLVVVNGAWRAGSLVDCESRGGTTRGRTLLTSFSRFSTKFVGKDKPVIHYPYFH